jgi:ribosomal protein S18 acetylase RimI-like enzyme
MPAHDLRRQAAAVVLRDLPEQAATAWGCRGPRPPGMPHRPDCRWFLCYVSDRRSMLVRQLGPGDAQAYQHLRLLALKESPTAFSASDEEEVGRTLDEVARRIAPAKDGSICMLGIFDSDELAGFLAIIHPQREKLRHRVELAGMYVAPHLRRRGLGRAILAAAIAHARSIGGVRQVRLGVNAENAAAKGLYRAVGFVSCGIEPDALQVDGVYYGEERFVLRLG